MTAKDLEYIHFWEQSTAPESPTLLLLHGTGGTERDLIDIGHRLWPDASILSPRGPVSEHGQARFFRRLAEGVFDLDDLRKRTDNLVQFVGNAAEVYGFDPRRVVAVGFSNGANIAASVLLSKAGTLIGAVLLHPMVPFEPESLPDLRGTAVFLGAGRQDPLVPEASTLRLAELLTASGANVETHWSPGGHNLSRAELEAATAWIRKGDQPWN